MKILLDLFCGAGGCAMGYHRAGFNVSNGWQIVGVDINPQPRYPFQFIQYDAIAFARKWGTGMDFIHASPPCQGYSRMNRFKTIANSTIKYPKLIEPTRQLLRLLKKPYVIENVSESPLIDPIHLCGCMFPDLRVYRERLFESSFHIDHLAHATHSDPCPPAGSGVSPKYGYVSITRGGVNNLPDGWTPAAYKNMAMNIDWMTQTELTESVPPHYTHWIGGQWRKLQGLPYSLPDVQTPEQLKLAF